MSMISPHPVLDPNAQAKSMIDAVTGHQPSPWDGDYSSEKLVQFERSASTCDVCSSVDHLVPGTGISE
jgi:hypothetical protein